ncbi:MAG: sulfotransferase [Bacteroidota bacterium]
MIQQLNRTKKIIAILLNKEIRCNNGNYFFIIGSGRCGSTLLRVILERNPEISVLPEISMALPRVTDLFIANKKKTYEEHIALFYQEYSSEENWDALGIDYEDIRRNLTHANKPVPDFIKAIHQSYSEKQNKTALIFGDKHPYLTFHIPYLFSIFPRAKFIHLIRDGRDVACSWNRTKGLEMPLLEAAKRWNWALKEVERFKFLIKKNLIELSYETLVAQPEKTIRQICKFLGVSYSKELLSSENNRSTKEIGVGHHENAVKEISTTSFGKWKRTLSETEMDLIMPILKKRLIKYNYFE